MIRFARVVGVVILVGIVAQVVASAEQAAVRSLGSVQVIRKALIDGETLASGTYTLRLTADPVVRVVGQNPDESAWVEFVQAGKVKGRAMATVLTAADVKAVRKGAVPASGSARTDVLKGNDYLRIWVNRAGTHYLIHLALAPKS